MLTIRKRDASDKAGADASQPQIAVAERDGVLACVFSGNWTTRRVGEVDAEMRKVEKRNGFKTLALDLPRSGAWIPPAPG